VSSAHTSGAKQGGTGNVMHLAEEEDDGLTFIRPVSVSPLEVVNHFYLVQNKQMGRMHCSILPNMSLLRNFRCYISNNKSKNRISGGLGRFWPDSLKNQKGLYIYIQKSIEINCLTFGTCFFDFV